MTEEREESKQQPVVVVKKKSGHGGHHGGAWKVAYADFVTAMMAFFLVMWLVNQSDAVKQAVQGYFQNPIGYMKSKGEGVLEGEESPIKHKNGKSVLSNRLEQERELLLDAGERISSAIDNIPELRGLKEFVEIEMTPEGLRIQLIDSDKKEGANFFDLGSAELKPTTSLLLTAIASELGKLPNYIVVEGHTDSKPYMGLDDYSNWELSADRANSARKLMESAGLQAGQIVEIRGNADRRPKFSDNPQDPRNRRVAIIVLNEDAADRYLEI
jgi:chemotaxis protein MotB